MMLKVNCSAVFNLETMLAAPGEVTFWQQSLLSIVKLAFVRRERSSCFKITLFSHYLTILGGPPPALQDIPDSLVSLYSHHGKVWEQHLVCKLSQTWKAAQNTTIMWGTRMEVSSVDVNHGWLFHPWMTFLHPWMAFLHPWMTSLHPWMTSTDDISPSMDGISPSIDDISPSMDDISPSMDGIFNCQVFGKKCLHHILNEFVSNYSQTFLKDLWK